MRGAPNLVIALCLVATLLFAGCSEKRASPEDQLRALIKNAVTAAAAKDLGTLRDAISDRYSDEHGQDKRAIENLLRVHFLRNTSIHLFAHTQSVSLQPPNRARAVVLVAMAGVPIPDMQELPLLRADLHRFEIEFAREDKDWRVQQAAWRRAELSEFAGQ